MNYFSKKIRIIILLKWYKILIKSRISFNFEDEFIMGFKKIYIILYIEREK